MSDKSKSNINLYEFRYYQYLKKKHSKLTHLPKCYTFIDTSLGSGLVFDFIGTQQQPAPTLTAIIQQNMKNKSELLMLVNELFDYLNQQHIAFCDSGLDNLVLLHNKIYIIDGQNEIGCQ